MSNFSDPAPINYSFKDKVPQKRGSSIWQKITFFLLVVLVVSSLVVIKIQSDQLNDYRNTIYTIQTQIQTQVATQQAENNALKTQVATQQIENNMLKTQIATLESKINSLITPTPTP